MKLLIVEDEIDTLEEICDYTRGFQSEWELHACSNPLEAIEKCRTTSFDAALLDISMPEMSGLDLADRISEMQPSVSFVFITAYNHYATEAFELNAVDYILKPIRRERFEKALSRIQPSNYSSNRISEFLMPLVDIRTFGKLVVSAGGDILQWKRKKSSEVFAFLLCEGGAPIHKDRLCELLWPETDPQKGLAYLQTVMYQLRKSITAISDGQITIEFADDRYRLVLGNVRYDIDLFLKAYAGAFSDPDSPDFEKLLEAEELYRSPFLEEEGWLWSMSLQEDFSLKHQRILDALIQRGIAARDRIKTPVFIRKWFHSGYYDHTGKYLQWVEQELGPEQARQLEVLFE